MGTDGGHRAGVLACFDESSAAVFASLCRLSGGDADRALDTLVETYCAHDVSSVDPLDAAVRVFLATAPRSVTGAASLAAGLSPTERAVAELNLFRHMSVADAAAAIDRPVEEVRTALDAAVEVLSIEGTGPADALRHGEVWFDDAMRSTARQRLSDRCGAPEPTSVTRRRSRRRTNALIGAASAVFGAALVLWVTAGNRDEPGTSEAPQPPASLTALGVEVDTTTVTPPGVVASGTISSIGEGVTTDITTTATPVTTRGSTPTTSATIDSVETVDTVDTVEQPSTPRSVGFVLDPIPEGFVALTGTDLETNDEPRSSWQSVWSSDGATRTSGRWFAVALTDEHSTLRRSGDSGNDPIFRFTSAERQTQLFVDPDGVQHTVVRLDPQQLMEFASFGVSTDQIATMVEAATIADDRSITFAPAADSVLESLSLRSTTQVGDHVLEPYGLFNEDFRSWYGTPDGQAFLLVSSGPQRPNDLLTASLLLGPSADPSAPVAPSRTVDVSGQAAVIGQWDDGFEPSMQIVTWHQGGQTLTVRGTVGLDITLQAARSARPATVDEWQVLLDAPSPSFVSASPSQGELRSGRVGSTVTQAGSTWVVQINDAHFPRNDGRLGDGAISVTEKRPRSDESSVDQGGERWFPLTLDPAMPLTHFESIDATVLVVALSQPTEAVTMRVTVHDERRVDVPIVGVPDTQVAGAAYAFSEEAPFTVELLDTTGAVIQTLTP